MKKGVSIRNENGNRIKAKTGTPNLNSYFTAGKIYNLDKDKKYWVNLESIFNNNDKHIRLKNMLEVKRLYKVTNTLARTILNYSTDTGCDWDTAYQFIYKFRGNIKAAKETNNPQEPIYTRDIRDELRAKYRGLLIVNQTSIRRIKEIATTENISIAEAVDKYRVELKESAKKLLG